jgi:hypothetical protein|tara:strand:- start:354 stop:743 length:390 start_codon:yes stop_codon:yes gene_type:complete
MPKILNVIAEPVTKILDKFVLDKDLKIRLEHELKTELHKANLGQIEVNKMEAQSRHWFTSSWRPCVGWICAFALAYHFILEPILVFGLSIYGLEYDLPEFDMGSLMTILMGMLGLAGARSWEKSKGITK